MTLEEIRKIVLVQAFEESDLQEEYLQDEDKRAADATAGSPLPQSAGRKEQHQFLGKRATFLNEKIRSHCKSVAWMESSPFRQRLNFFGLGLVVVAALIGFFTNELGPEKRINILSFPLLGILVWNLIIYLLEIFTLVARRGKAPSGVVGLVSRFVSPLTTSGKVAEDEGAIISRSASLYHSRWRELNLPAIAARIKALLHVTAIVLAVSAIAGMYFKGVANEYRAVWESTFFREAKDLRPFLEMVLGPAASLLNQSIPSVAELDGIHYRHDNPVEGGNAGNWIHWYAITIGMFVVLPRLLFALIWKFKAHRQEVAMPFRKTNPDYFDRVLSSSTGHSLLYSLVPYAHEASREVRQKVRKLLETEYSRPVSVNWCETVPFGEEDEAELTNDDVGHTGVIYNFASTPEKETHLALFKTLAGETENKWRVILDAESFDRKSESFSDAEQRRETRLSAWKTLFAGTNTEIIVISPSQSAS
ncbi:MAG: DUF2868 domain-containing protein [Verrucomicrobiota bacterium]